MRLSTRLPLALLLLGSSLVSPSSISAHFLFVRIANHAEAGRAVEVFFSERAAAGDPKYMDRIDNTQLWLQSEPGKFQPLKVQVARDRLRSLLPSQQAVGVVGTCTYGVLSRDVTFLLQHFPKAINGDPEKLNQLQPLDKIPLEITATIKDGTIQLVALADGKPMPEALFTTVDDDLLNDEIQADKSGVASWSPVEPGHYSVYVGRQVERSGSYKGEKYEQIRQFATLSFHWPLVRTSGDEDAIELFENAIKARAQWADFPGFRATISGTVDDRVFDGTVTVASDGSMELATDEPTVEDWIEDRLGSIVLHRMPQDPQGDRPILHFADRDMSHPMGRLLTFVGGSFASSYRVRDNQILVVNRNIGRQNFTITVLDNLKNADDRFLPGSYVVRYWNATSGQLVRSETVQQRWQRVGKIDLPTAVTVSTASQTGLQVRSMQLSKHELLASP